jgi:hypothetical protein
VRHEDGCLDVHLLRLDLLDQRIEVLVGSVHALVARHQDVRQSIRHHTLLVSRRLDPGDRARWPHREYVGRRSAPHHPIRMSQQLVPAGASVVEGLDLVEPEQRGLLPHHPEARAGPGQGRRLEER